MDAKTESLLLKARKGSVASFEAKQWEAVLCACGFTVTRGRDIFIATHEETGKVFSEQKQAGYRRITFYDLTRALHRAGLSLEAMASAALGLPSIAEEKAAKQKAAVDFSESGTCQCCFGFYKSTDGIKLALHGYQRPGVGHVIGRCLGEGHPPFEVSCEKTRVFKWLLEEKRVEARLWESRLLRNDIEVLSYENASRERDPATGKHPPKIVGVRPGEERQYRPEGLLYDTPSFSELLARELKDVTWTIQQLTKHIDSLAEKIRTWAPVPWPAKKAS